MILTPVDGTEQNNRWMRFRKVGAWRERRDVGA